ncbi:GNAT family N-acetyltransferase [Paractinoplanes durhamensis]|uniref:GNAT family N-acetyltransferase n=1 Tax=Paractinoplanes durhamensis TaxID=113563 RepID=UPI003636C1F1
MAQQAADQLPARDRRRGRRHRHRRPAPARGASGEIGYGIHPDRWGRGAATAAARELLRQAFEEHYLHRVYGTCDPRNSASARVLLKIGMAYEGRMRETVRIRDGWRDSDLYAILEQEWRAR